MVVNSKISPMLTVREVANLLHVHSNTVRRWSDRGLITAHRITQRGDRRYKLEDVGRFLAEMNDNNGSPSK
jgi:excisionase family DNA binding protein